MNSMDNVDSMNNVDSKPDIMNNDNIYNKNSVNKSGFINNYYKKLTDKKFLPIYIAIGVLIVSILLYFYFRSSRVEDEEEITFNDYKEKVDKIILKHSDRDFGNYGKLSKACRYALIGGKRIRPVIFINIINKMGKSIEDYEDIVLSIEYLHTCSLIIDDIQDKDSQRRGRETLHYKVGEKEALLAATSIGFAALQNIIRQSKKLDVANYPNAYRLCMTLIEEVSSSLGIHGASSGQYLDTYNILNEDDDDKEKLSEELENILAKKTATFFEIPYIAGWLLGGGDENKLDKIKKAANDFGLAFQITDDYEDTEKDLQKQENGESIQAKNYNIFFGDDQTKNKIIEHLNSNRKILEELQLWNFTWDDISTILINKIADQDKNN